MNKRILAIGGAIGVLVLAAGLQAVFAQKRAPHATPAVVQQQSQSNNEVQSPSYTGSITVDQRQTGSMSESDEAAALQKMAHITAAQAKAAAESAHPGATAVKVDLDNENGVVVYSVELSNGLDVKVDAGNGKILHTEPPDSDRENGESNHGDDGEEHEDAVEQ